MKKHTHSGLAVLALIMLLVLGLAVSVVFAQTSGGQPIVQGATWVASAAQAPFRAAPGAVSNDVEIMAARTSTNTVFLPQVFSGFTYPHFAVTKSASQPRVGENEIVVYTVAFTNTGDLPGVIETIQDTLPAGFTFQHMEEGSAVDASPIGTSGTIIWNGPFTVTAHSDLKLVYAVQAASTLGTYTNTATATTLVGSPPQEPGTATVVVGPSFIDDFEGGVDNWTPYTNIRRMNEDQWYWDGGGGYDGSAGYTHWCKGGVTDPDDYAEDTLTMVLIEGAEDWTDYRYSVRFNMHGGKQIGVWFRGTYRESENTGQWATGYYFTVRVRKDGATDEAILWQLRTEEEPGDETWPPYWYHVTNPLELVEVELATPVELGEWHQITVDVVGNRIKCYVDDELAIDFVDDEGSIFWKGTVGLVGYGNPYADPKRRAWGLFTFDDVMVEPLH